MVPLSISAPRSKPKTAGAQAGTLAAIECHSARTVVYLPVRLLHVVIAAVLLALDQAVAAGVPLVVLFGAWCMACGVGGVSSEQRRQRRRAAAAGWVRSSACSATRCCTGVGGPLEQAAPSVTLMSYLVAV